jgi:hypothetical protein
LTECDETSDFDEIEQEEVDNDNQMEMSQEEKDDDDDEITIICIDPAPNNCGISVYDFKNKMFLEVITKNFCKRLDAKTTDMGNTRLLESVAKFVKNTALFHEPNTIVFVENQSVGGTDNKAFSNSRNLAVQYCFQSVLGANKCVPVAPSAVKAHFRHEFPLLPKATHSRSRQYRLDKKNAIAFGSRLVGHRLKQKIMSRKNKKIDDSYDAVVITQFVLERFRLCFSEEEQCVVYQQLAPHKKKPKHKTRAIRKK